MSFGFCDCWYIGYCLAGPERVAGGARAAADGVARRRGASVGQLRPRGESPDRRRRSGGRGQLARDSPFPAGSLHSLRRRRRPVAPVQGRQRRRPRLGRPAAGGGRQAQRRPHPGTRAGQSLLTTNLELFVPLFLISRRAPGAVSHLWICSN